MSYGWTSRRKPGTNRAVDRPLSSAARRTTGRPAWWSAADDDADQALSLWGAYRRHASNRRPRRSGKEPQRARSKAAKKGAVTADELADVRATGIDRLTTIVPRSPWIWKFTSPIRSASNSSVSGPIFAAAYRKRSPSRLRSGALNREQVRLSLSLASWLLGAE